MGAKAIGLAKKLARELAYRSLEDAVGRTLTVEDPQKLKAALTLYLPCLAECEPLEVEPKFFVGALLKYGIIDATFAGPTELLDARETKRGVGLLRELDLAESGDAVEFEHLGLEALVEGLSSDTAFVRVFLQTDRPTLKDAVRLSQQDELPNGYFPRTFAIVDACVTNCDAVWLVKHFYL